MDGTIIDVNSEELSSLNFTIIDQQSLEAKVEKALDDAVADHSKKQHLNILKNDEIEIEQEIKKLIQKKEDFDLRLQSMKRRVTDPRSVFDVENKMKETDEHILSLKERMEGLSNQLTAYENGISLISKDEYLPKEDDVAEKIKKGEMTPFGTIIKSFNSQMTSKSLIISKTNSPKAQLTDFEKYLKDQMDRQKSTKRNNKNENKPKTIKLQANSNFVCKKENINGKLSKKRKIQECNYEVENETKMASSSPCKDSDYVPSDSENSSEDKDESDNKNTKGCVKMKKEKDDGNLADYKERINKMKTERLKSIQLGETQLNEEFHEISNGFKMPISMWESLFKYQRTGVQWLWELHDHQCGGIIGDEMGLGKTIQMIAFLVGISVSKVTSTLGNWRGLGPVLIICPATVLHQWLREFHKWWPQFRVAILHGSGSFTGKRPALIHNINSCNGILLTSYNGAREQLRTIIQYQWQYLILDEGHYIRNPLAQITTAVKKIDTPHRIILSGSPIQNSLKELWSLFDFIFPGKLGTLAVFLQQFAVPITQGGYSNASKLQVQTAYRCATLLRDTISPYLLRRMKSDVREHLSLPDKNEQVLFCGLTDEQRNEYRSYLDGHEVKMIFRGQLLPFVGLITVRKICNHPDIFCGGPRSSGSLEVQPETKYGYWKRSGKMVVLHSILKLWKKQEHKVLLFTQSRQMIQILSKFIVDEGYMYLKMDGSTTVNSRQLLIEKFNNDPSIFIFLLTTRVGGIGVNLTGADRVVIYDPDWNPSTDLQARERAWRIGQLRNVTIYRLLTAGTIEEKIYHRQLFKQSITNRVLKDPKQQRFFKTSDLNELFTLSDGDKVTETSALFAGTGSEIKPKRRKVKEKIEHSSNDDRSDIESKALKDMQDDEDDSKEPQSQNEYEQQMRQLAKLISKQIGECSKIKKLKSKQGKKCEGERIHNLVKKRTFKNSTLEDQSENVKQDEYVLKKLFKKSGIHSAYSHDTIVEGCDPDHLLLVAEADRVAKDALKKVKASRWLCSSGRINPKRRFGVKTNTKIEIATDINNPHSNTKEDISNVLSSAQLLSMIKQRNVDRNDIDEIEELDNGDENVELLTDIRNFVAFQSVQNGEATTEEILNKFRYRLPAEKSLIFRTLLNQICDFNKINGTGIWHLKTEYR